MGNALPSGGEIPEEGLERLGADVVETLLARTVDLRPKLLEKAHSTLAGVTEKLLAEARRKSHAFFDAEKARLEHLHQTEEGGAGDLIYASAFQSLEKFRVDCEEILRRAEWRFDAVRVVLCQEGPPA